MDPAFGTKRQDASQSAADVVSTLSTEALETALDVLTADRRRRAFQHLAAEERTLHLTDLVDRFDDDETDVAVDLHHNHLPKLAASGLLTYDTEAHLAAVTDAGRQAAPLVDAVAQQMK